MNRIGVTKSGIRTLVAAAAVVGSTGCAATLAEPPTAAPFGAATITADDLFARVEFFASDGLRGRDTPSPGLDAAAAYIVSEHRRTGLEPAGENGTYYQQYPLNEAMAPNVAAVLRGSDPLLREEYVILSAHMDHVGVGRPVDGDSIYNGADDNASGTAALLEVAQAFASLPAAERPRRSIVFLHVSGEEKGLLGSRWYADNPTVPVERIVANINVDMIARNAPDTVVVIGKEYSTLGQVVDRVSLARPELGLVAADDLWPDERFFFRSDHFNFARREIPAIFFFTGVHEDYHRPSDTVEKLDFGKAERVTRLIYYVVREIADDPRRPEWDPEGLEEVRALTR
jgi:Zn-dependent M28 family amino/carboxypeptidase